MLVYFEPAAMCPLHQTGLSIAPLPAKKQLWEAGDESAWKAESEREAGAAAQSAFALSANGELLKLRQGQLRWNQLFHPGTAPWRTADWDEWCSGMDGLGGLVMLAASMVS